MPPGAIAKEALRLLALDRLPPTPDNFRTAYYKASGEPAPVAAEPVRTQAVVKPRSASLTDDQSALSSRLHWMLIRAIKLGVQPTLSSHAGLQSDGDELLDKIERAKELAEFEALSAAFSALLYKCAGLADDAKERSTKLQRLVDLALANFLESQESEGTLAQEIRGISTAFTHAKEPEQLVAVERQLKNVLIRQGTTKKGLEDAKQAMRALMATFVERLKSMVSATGGYEQRLNTYATQIRASTDIASLGKLVQNIVEDTANVQLDITRAQQDMAAAQAQVHAAELRIAQLQAEVAKLGDLAKADPLTGALNRRGLDEAFTQSMSLAARQQLPLSVVLLDIDNFKRLNDSHGHQAGDQVLAIMTQTIAGSLRASDSVARIGGEEFVILMPATGADAAIEVVRRLQRSMTSTIFMFDQQQIFVTFSAGVALWDGHESASALLERADRALYRAKQAGKNRVEPAL
jgi:diguanylate cyclase